jgi:hypothetical protein
LGLLKSVKVSTQFLGGGTVTISMGTGCADTGGWHGPRGDYPPECLRPIPCPAFCDHETCVGDNDPVDRLHSGATFTLSSPTQGDVHVYAGRIDEPIDYATTGTLGIPHVTMTIDQRHLWSSHWQMQDDRDGEVVYLDFLPDAAGRFGFALIHQADVAAATPTTRLGAGCFLSWDGSAVEVYISRLGMSDQRFVNVVIPTNECGQVEADADGSVCLTLTPEHAQQLGQSLMRAADAAGRSLPDVELGRSDEPGPVRVPGLGVFYRGSAACL